LHLDPGGFSDFSNEVKTKQTAALLDIYQSIGIDVLNVSGKELAENAERFITLASLYDFPFISSNLIFNDSKKAVFPDHAILQIGDLKVAVVGITQLLIGSWELENGKAIVVGDPTETLPPLVKELEKDADAIILLAHYPKRYLGKLLNKIDEVDLVIGADGFSTTSDLEEISGVPVCYASKQGQALGNITIKFSQDGPIVLHQKVVRLTPDYPEDKFVKEMVEKHMKRINVGSTKK
jgi:2',3'-cyclic-nucleotide 2'-phosphodiesterase (5'-nucleotidase family)